MRRRFALGLLLGAVTLSGCGPQVTPDAPRPATGTPAPAATVAPTQPPVLPPTAVPPTATAAPPATAVPPAPATPAPVTDAQPATDPRDAAQRFLAALQADRTGRLAANYAGGTLATTLRNGVPDIGGLLGEQNPFTGFTVNGVVGSAPPFSYVQVTFAYGSTPQPLATRVLDVQEQGGFFVVTAIGPASPIPQPAADAQGVVQQFMAALQADPSGGQAAQYAGGPFAQALLSGSPGAEVLLGEPLPYTSFTVDGLTATIPPNSYVQVTIAYGEPAQRRATRIVEVRDEGGALRVYGLAPAAIDDPAQSAEQQARVATAEFLGLMNEGRYQEAVGRFAGDLAPILAQNPDLSGDAVNDLELRGRLLERACSAGGGRCLAQRRIVDAELIADGGFMVWVEFNRPDGELYVAPDGNTAVRLRVERTDRGWQVFDLPPAP